MYTMGSLFDGIGGFPLAAVHNGIVPIWASEIEHFPIEVTKIRFPEMLHVGDITKLDGAKLPAVDVICGGSPCQDLSVAGARAGFAGERSGLFMEQTRVAKEMRNADGKQGRANNLIRPRFFVWENVPGAFSSAEGEDFKAVLEETARIADNSVSIPRPPGGVWKPAGCILGDQFSIAWRVLDAQYWGVAQRRKRIFLVADFGGHTAPQILFEQDRLFGDTAEGEVERKGIAAAIERGIADTGRNKVKPMLCLNDQGGNRMDITEDITSTLRASMGGNLPIVMGSQQGGIAIVQESYCIASNTINRQDKNGGNGCGFQENISYTLTTSDIHAVCSIPKTYQDIVGALCVGDEKGIGNQYVSQDKCIIDFKKMMFADVNDNKGHDTLHKECENNGSRSENFSAAKNLVRRLTPLECERLQGFPDGWTDIPKAADSPRYKALGNSVAVPCVDFIMRGIAYFLCKFKQGEEDN